jgi:hypothetical protein
MCCTFTRMSTHVGPCIHVFMPRFGLQAGLLIYTQFLRMGNTVTSNKSRPKTRKERKVAEAAEHERRIAQKEFAAFGAERERRPGALSPPEVWWCKQYQWLKAQGYLLRPRYAPEWVPSWDGSQRDPFTCEDGQVLEVRLRKFGCIAHDSQSHSLVGSSMLLACLMAYTFLSKWWTSRNSLKK